jgi:hypothetical protein
MPFAGATTPTSTTVASSELPVAGSSDLASDYPVSVASPTSEIVLTTEEHELLVLYDKAVEQLVSGGVAAAEASLRAGINRNYHRSMHLLAPLKMARARHGRLQSNLSHDTVAF